MILKIALSMILRALKKYSWNAWLCVIYFNDRRPKFRRIPWISSVPILTWVFQGNYDELDEIDDMSEIASSYAMPKTVAPMGSQERGSIADQNANLFGDGTLRGSILRGKSRILKETSEKFKDLTLDEVVNLLEHHNQDVKANAAGYIQHLAYNNDENKNDIRNCGGIPKLIDILEERNDDPRIIGMLKTIRWNSVHSKG